jgi:hypothetical protein
MVAPVLELQRRAGNQATTALLDELTGPWVQRQPDDDVAPRTCRRARTGPRDPRWRRARAILAKLHPVLDQDQEVVVGQSNHFVRLKALDDDGITKDDPGDSRGATLRHTWEEARALGLFENFLIVG